MLTQRTARYDSYRGHRIATAPASEPITLADVKSQLAIDRSADDALLTLYIASAREHAEQMTGLALINQTWRLTLDGWPGHGEPWRDGARDTAISSVRSTSRQSNIILPRYPLQSITSMTADGESVTVADVFTIDTQQMPGRLVIKSGQAWPVVVENANGIVIDYVAGFGTTAANVPSALKVGLLQMVASLYTHRGDECSIADAWANSGAKVAFSAYEARGL